jgi:hypothetical protein
MTIYENTIIRVSHMTLNRPASFLRRTLLFEDEMISKIGVLGLLKKCSRAMPVFFADGTAQHDMVRPG